MYFLLQLPREWLEKSYLELLKDFEQREERRDFQFVREALRPEDYDQPGSSRQARAMFSGFPPPAQSDPSPSRSESPHKNRKPAPTRKLRGGHTVGNPVSYPEFVKRIQTVRDEQIRAAAPPTPEHAPCNPESAVTSPRTPESAPSPPSTPDPDQPRCSDCNRSFLETKSYLRHLQTDYHKNVYKKVRAVDGKFHCQLCSKLYGDERSLTRHVRIKHDRFKFGCPYCHKEFASGDYLAIHIMKCKKSN